MNMNELKSYFAAQGELYKERDVNSMMELIYEYHVELNPVDNDEIRNTLSNVDQVLQKLTVWENTVLMDLIFDLCTQYESKGFQDGMRYGFQLSAEMAERM